MDNSAAITVGIFVFGVIFALIAIIYTTLDKKTCKNENDITDIKDRFITKEDSNRENDKLDTKLDKIISILLEGGR